MRFAINVAFISFALSSAPLLLAAEPTFKVRPIEIITRDDIPTSARELLYSGDRDVSFEISYLVEGANLVGIKPDSFHVDSILLRDGRDLMKSAGKDFVSMAPFSDAASADRKFARFKLIVKTNEFQKTDGLTIKGSVTAITAAERKKLRGTIKIDSKEPVELGPFKLTYGEGAKDAVAEGFVAGFSQIFSGGQAPETVPVTVVGPLEKIVTICSVEDETETQPNESFSGKPDERTYKFVKPKNDTLRISIDYYLDFTEHKIEFDNPTTDKKVAAKDSGTEERQEK